MAYMAGLFISFHRTLSFSALYIYHRSLSLFYRTYTTWQSFYKKP
jgi:hypothetical protein